MTKEEVLDTLTRLASHIQVEMRLTPPCLVRVTLQDVEAIQVVIGLLEENDD
jgi:hypothetical protein